jgi:hypothetical protein
VFAVLIFLGSFSTPAYAYLDPGTGTMILQGLIAAFGAVMGFFYYFFDKIKQFFKPLRGRSVATDATECSSREKKSKKTNL